MQTYVRLMVVKHRYGWGYETLMREVSDSLQLRRFCLIGLGEAVPDESTVRKLTRRLGAETVNELSRLVIGKARRETRFRARAVRIDSTVVEGDVRYPTDGGLAADGVRVLARDGKRLARLAEQTGKSVRDRSRAVGRRLREIGRTLKRRSGNAKGEVLELTRQTGGLLAASVREARQVAAQARERPRRLKRSGKAKARRKAEKILSAASGWRRSSSAATRSPPRSASGWPASRSPSGSCRSSTPTPARSARASSAAPMSSGTSRNWRR
jgi:IS5 family transposase